MTKAEIVNVIAEGTGLTKLETATIIDGFMATVSYALQNGDRVELRGFGSFFLRERQEKHVPNPKTGKMMVIPHRIVPDFKPSPHLKSYVAKGMKNSGKFISKTEQTQTNVLQELDRWFLKE